MIMKFPSSAYCKHPRQIIIGSSQNIMLILTSSCSTTYLKKTMNTQQKGHDNASTHDNRVYFNLFNYLNWVWTSKSYRSERAMKSDWIGKKQHPNNNFMKAISHPQYNMIIKKIIECNHIKLLNQIFLDKSNRKD